MITEMATNVDRDVKGFVCDGSQALVCSGNSGFD